MDRLDELVLKRTLLEYAKDIYDFDEDKLVKKGEVVDVQDIINAPATQSRPEAHWVYDPNGHDWNLGCWTCSRCRFRNEMIPTVLDTKKGRIGHDNINPYAFDGSSWCAGCGAKMRETGE